jgi:hypothetical protein
MTRYLERPLSTFLKDHTAFDRTLILSSLALVIWLSLYGLSVMHSSFENRNTPTVEGRVY